MKPRPVIPTPLVIIGSLTLTIALFCCSVGLADGITASESELLFRGPRTEPLQRTFSMRGMPLPKLSVVRRDLVNPETGAVILSNNVSVSSVSRREATADAAGEETFSVTVSGATRSGHYVGTLEIREDAKPTGSPIAVKLDVTLESVPSVDADASSKSLTLFVRQPWLDIPYIGDPAATPNGAAAGKGLAASTINLIQSAEGDASVEEAIVLPLRGSKGQTLPPDAVRVDSRLPLPITGPTAKPVGIIVSGENLSAGEYNGSLRIRVHNQTAPVQIPLKVMVKDGPTLALLTLIIGLLAATLFTWWGTQGNPTRDLVNQVQKLADDIKGGSLLQATERDEATRLLAEVMTGVETGQPYAELKKKFDDAQSLVTTTRTEAQKLLGETLEPALSRVSAITAGVKIRDRFVSTLEAIRERVKTGKYERLSDAGTALQDPANGVVEQIGRFVDLASRLAQVPEDRREQVKTAMDQADTEAGLRKALQDAGVQQLPALSPGKSFDISASAAATATSKVLELSFKRRLQLSLGAAVVAIIAYVFVLVIGWISVYVKSDTFGADPLDYITLFLWGATIEAVRGKTVSFTSLKSVAETKPAVK